MGEILNAGPSLVLANTNWFARKITNESTKLVVQMTPAMSELITKISRCRSPTNLAFTMLVL